jgi:hypothetical protein
MHAGVVLRNHAKTHFLRVTRPFPPKKWLFLRGLAMSSVSTLVDQLKTAEGEALQKLLYALAELLDKASGDTSDALRAELRKIGAVAVISKLLTHEAKQIHQLAINIAGSLAATALDPQAGLSNSLLKQAGAFDHLLRHLLTTKDDTTLLYALIAIQNMCVEIEYVNELKAAGGIKRLQHIAGQTDPQLRQFAQCCLDNARTVVAIYAMQQKAVKSTPKTRTEAGKYLAHAYVRRWRARQGVRQGVRPSSVALQASLVDQLKNEDDATLVKLLYSVAVQLDDASGESAISLCAELRASGAVAVISNLIAHGSSQIHRLAISIIGNLASTALDPQAGLSNGLLKQAGAFDHLLRHLFSTDQGIILLTVVAIQNMCVEIEYVNKLKAAGGIKRLQHIVGQTDPQLRQFAQGCLDNARTVVVIDAMQQKAVKSTPKTRTEAGKYLAHAYVRRWRARRAATVTGASDLSAGVDASFSPANTILDQRQHAHTVAGGEDLQDVQLAITTLQSVLRGKQKRAELERTKKEKIAAQRLQRVLRGHQARGVASAILRARNMERAAIRIQRCGRNRLLRKLLIRKAVTAASLTAAAVALRLIAAEVGSVMTFAVGGNHVMGTVRYIAPLC